MALHPLLPPSTTVEMSAQGLTPEMTRYAAYLSRGKSPREALKLTLPDVESRHRLQRLGRWKLTPCFRELCRGLVRYGAQLAHAMAADASPLAVAGAVEDMDSGNLEHRHKSRKLVLEVGGATTRAPVHVDARRQVVIGSLSTVNERRPIRNA